MAATDSVTLAWINYCCRQGYYRQLQTVCLDSLKKYGNDPVLVFWKAYGMLMEDNLNEAISEFDSIKEKRDVVLCSLMALIIANKRTRTADKQSIQQLEAKLKSERTKCGETALFFGGMFLFHSGKADKAREYVDRMLKMSAESKEGLILRGWVDIRSTKDQYVKKSIKYFDEVLNNSSSSKKEIDALLGKVEYLKLKNNFTGALEIVNQLIVMYPDFTPGLMEKMRIQLALQDWDQTVETCQRIFAVDNQNIEALHFTVLNLMCRETNYDEATEKITLLIQSLDRLEPNNVTLYATFSRCYARLCGRNQLILQQSYTLIDRARSISSRNADLLNEVGYQLLLQGKLKESMKAYKQAMKIDESSVKALLGIIHCQILLDQLDEAQQQLEFFREIQSSIGKTAEILYLTALFGMKKGKSSEEVMQLLQETVETHFATLTGLPLGGKYFEILNPDFLLDIVNMFLMYAPVEPNGTMLANDMALRKSSLVLEPVVKTVPGLTQALFMFAKVKFISGDIENAKLVLQRCLDNNPAYVNAHILMAQIHLHNSNYSACDASLENGLSYNFEVKDSPIYHIIKAKTQKKQKLYDDALNTLTVAMNLRGMKRTGSAGRKPSKFQPTLGDRVAVYLELADVQRHLNMTHEAVKTMQDAINEFSGTPEEIKVTIANAEFSLLRGDLEHALSSMRQITPEQSYYIQARQKMAEIYLKHRKDKRLYIGVYRELVEQKPSSQAYLLLGDAYMSIQEPEKAIEVYETALKRNPKDASLASKIGQAFVKTHQYGKAINYYEAAVRSGNQNFLRFDLAELHMKLKNYEKAERLLKVVLKDEATNDLVKLTDEARCMFLLARIYQKTKESEDTAQAFIKARDVQARVIKRVSVDQPDDLPEQKALATKISCEIGEHYTTLKDYDKAIKSYKEAIFYDQGNSSIMLALSKLYLLNGDLDSCQQQLVTVLKNDKDNDQATLMLADLMCLKNEYDAATFHFQQLLEKKPCNYDALSKLVELLRRTGKLHECDKFLDQAKHKNPRAAMEAGYNFCKGLAEWYQNNATIALKHFNFARKDSFWGEKALYNMVLICLNPDSEIVGGETFEVDNTAADLERHDSEQMALKTAERLLKEIKPGKNAIRLKVLQNQLLLATKNQALVQKALGNLTEIVQHDNNCVPALHAMATAYMILKQTPKARNQLKRIAKMDWNSEDADDFEKSWLLLADVYIQSGKYDMAQELLRKCLEHNKGCAKAWEYMGFVMEKEQAYKDAATNYENAWRFSNESNPAIGYRLGFNYLKARRFVDAIDVCHKVLGKHPNYPKIKKEIMDKARAQIRN